MQLSLRESVAAPEPDASPEPEAPSVELETPSGWGPRELTLIAAALVGSGAITLMLLSVGGASTSAAAGPVPATHASAAPASATAGGIAPHWIENSAGWTGGLRKSIALEVASRNETQVWMKTVRPLLVVRCVKGRADVFVFTDSAAAMEPQDEDHTVRLSFDEGERQVQRWPDSTEHDALFAPDGAAFLAQLERAKTFRFGYTPHNASPVVANFDVSGLAEKLHAGKAACGR